MVGDAGHLHRAVRVGIAITLAWAWASPAVAVDWNHDPDSDIGPPRWGALDPSFATCRTGRQQSPVDISRTSDDDAPVLVFEYQDTPLEVENNGHVIEVPYELGSHLLIDGEEYRLLQFHFHAPSEHTVDGAFADAEAHLVHSNSSGQLAVVGVFLDIDDDDANALIDLVLEHAPEEEGTAAVEGVVVNALDLLPLSGEDDDDDGDDASGSETAAGAFLTYPGSLTTPPCSEGVRCSCSRMSSASPALRSTGSTSS